MRAFALAAVLLLLAGCSSSGPNLNVTRTNMTVDRGTAEEVNLRMTKGAEVAYSWSTTGNIHFNVHSHDGGKVIEWIQTDGGSGSGTFKADYDGVFSFFWDNEAGTKNVALTYALTGEATQI